MQTDFGELIGLLPHFCMVFFNAKNDKYRAQTKTAYALDIKVFLHFLMTEMPDKFPYETMEKIQLKDLEQLTTDDLIGYMAWLDEYEMDGKIYKNAASGKKRKLSTLRALFHYFNGRGMLNNNPTIYVETPVIYEKEIVTLTDREKERMKALIDTGSRKKDKAKVYHEKTKYRDCAIYMLLLGTGIRVSELVGLDDRDVDYDEQKITVVRKGGKREALSFGREVRDALLDYIDVERYQLLGITEEELAAVNGNIPDGPLFVSLRGTRITVRRVEQIINEYGEYATTSAKNITPHILRKTFGTEVYDETKDLSLAQELLGHTTPQTTKKHYVRMDESRKEFVKQRKVIK